MRQPTEKHSPFKIEEMYRTLFENLPQKIFFKDKESVYISCNMNYAKYLDITPQGITGKTDYDFYPKELAEKYMADDKRVMETGEIDDIEEKYIHGGKEFFVHTVKTPVRDEKGNVIGMLGIFSDIAIHKLHKKALKRSGQLLQLFIEYSPAAIAMFDLDMKYIAASRRWFTDYKLGDQEIIGRSHYEVFPEIPERWKEIARRCLNGAVERSEEDMFVRSDGSIDWVRWEIRPWYQSMNEIGGIIIFSEVITGRKKAEEELAQYARDLSSLTRASNEMSFLPLHKNIYDTFCKTMVGDFGLDMVWLEMVKEETCEKAPIAGESSEQFLLEQIKFVWGFLREEPTSIAAEKLPGEIAADLRYPGEIAMLIDQDTCRIINDLSGHNLFPQWRDAALKLGYNSAAGLPLISSEGDFIGILHLFSRTPQFFTDDRLKIFDSFIKIAVKVIENRRLIEGLEHSVNMRTKEILTANEKLRELDRLKSMFIASMSHELRTPLNSIIGFSGILLDEWTGRLNDEQKQNLAIVLRSGKHLLAVINDVIDVSKIEAGTIDINVKDFDLYDVVKETSASFDNEIKDKGLTLEVESIHQMMHTDRRRLIQCLSNLVSNAVKFTEKGSVRLSARLIASSKVQVAREDLETRSNIKGQESSKAKDESALLRDPMALDPDNDFIEISVTDTGIGIKDEDMAQLFQPFTRLESPLKAAVPGTGLGLYLTRKLVTEALKGDIMGESEYGRGSKFTIRVPVSVV